MPTPTTTSYALLGLLALRSWTGYELTQQAARSLHYAWPRSEAHLYSEQKRLVALGWAAVEVEPAGRRTRNRYRITDAGHTALRSWLRTEPQGPRLEVEGVLRLFLADLGDADDAVAALRSTAAAARRDLDRAVRAVEEYLQGGGPFPERMHLTALAAEVVTDVLARLEAFAHSTAAEIDGWSTTRRDGLDDETRRRLERLVARHRAQPDAGRDDRS